MKHSKTITTSIIVIAGTILLSTLTSLNVVFAQTENTESKEAGFKIKVYENELNYFSKVSTSEILKALDSKNFKERKHYPPEKIKTSETTVIHNKFFTTYFRKIYNETSEADIIIYGLDEKLGSIDITVSNFAFNASKNETLSRLLDIVSILPEGLFPKDKNPEEFVKTASLKFDKGLLDGFYFSRYDGIDYRYLDLATETTLQITKEGN